MQRSFIAGGSRSCLNANGALSSRCASDLTSKTFTRSFGKHKAKRDSLFLLDPQSRADRLKAAGDRALQAKYERNAYNKQYRERRREQSDAKKDKKEDGITRTRAGLMKVALRQPTRDAMKAMKEDWALGPLAPRRDVGEMADRLGTVEIGNHGLPVLTKTQRKKIKELMGKNEFRVHDRVVVLTGRDRGKIGQILEIDEDNMSAKIDGINKIPIWVPDFMAKQDNDNRNFRIMRREVRLNELRLVCTVRDPENNTVREVILDTMDLKKVVVHAPGKTANIDAGTDPIPTDQGETMPRESHLAYELEDYKWKTFRYVPGTDTEIVDHSESYEEHNYDAEYGPEDTLLVSVDAQTYWPEIIEHPMPASVLKEISTRDRKEVTRFSEKIEESIRAKAEAKARKEFELEDKIRTPLQELKLQLKEEQRKAVEARMTEYTGGAQAPVSKKQKKKPSQIIAYEREDDAAAAHRQMKRANNPAPVSDVMIQIGRAMATNWAKNPDVVTGARRNLLNKVLEQEGNFIPEKSTEARV